MNKIIKKLHKTLFSLACSSFAISIFSFSAGANIRAARDLLLNSSFASSDHILSRLNLSAAAILSGEIDPGFFVHFDDLVELHNLGKNIHLGGYFLKSSEFGLGAYIKFNFTNNFYLGANIGFKGGNISILSNDYADRIIMPDDDPPPQPFIFFGNKISIAENTNLSTELSCGASFNTDIYYFVEKNYTNQTKDKDLDQVSSDNEMPSPTNNFARDTSKKQETLLDLNLNIGLDFKIAEFNVATRFSDFIGDFIGVAGKDSDKYFIGTPAFTISANTDTSWAFLSFGAKTNLEFAIEPIMVFFQATVKL